MITFQRKVAVLAIGRYGCHSLIKNRVLNYIIKPLNADLFITTDEFTNQEVIELKSTYKHYLKDISQIKNDFEAVKEEFHLTYFGPFKDWLKKYLEKQPKNIIKTIREFEKQNFKNIPDDKKYILEKVLEEYSPYQGLRQWYKYYYGINQIEEYQNKNKIQYNCIIKIRLDQPPITVFNQSIFNGIDENRIIANWDYNFYGSYKTMKTIGNLLEYSKENYNKIEKTLVKDLDFSLINTCLKDFPKNQSGSKFNFYSENLFLYFLVLHKIKIEQSRFKFNIDFYKQNNPQINFIFEGNPNKIKILKQKLLKTNFYSRVIFCTHSSRDYTLIDLKTYFKTKTNENVNILNNNELLNSSNLKLNQFLNKSLTLQIS